MCNFCDNIKDKEWYQEHNSWDRDNAIVQTGEKTFGLWIECEDCFYSGVAMKINFCPMCGADLTQKAFLKKKHAINPYYQKYGFDF